MNMKTLVSAVITALMASTAMAQTLDPVRVEMFRSILKGNECVLSEAAAANILPRFDFTRDETRAIVGALVAAGEVRLDGSTLNLIDGSCGTGNAVADLLGQSDVQQFIAVMSEHNCSMTEAEGEDIFTARGMTKAQVGTVVGPMIQAGMATFEAGVLSVDSAYCSAPVVAAAATPPPATPPTTPPAAELDRSGMFGLSRVRGLVDAMAQNGCTLNMEVADGYLAEAGIEHSFATFIGRKMLSDGFASMVDSENLLLPAPYCVSANAPVSAPVSAEVPSTDTPGVDMAMVATLREIFLANSCRLTEDQMDALLPPAGFTRNNIKPVFGFLEANGEMGEDGSDLVFYSDSCAPAPAEVAPATADAVAAGTPAAELDRSGMFGLSRVRGLVDAMAQNGCTLNMEVADGYLAEAGIEHSFATFIGRKMLSDGFASMVDSENLQLPAPYCVPAGGAAVVAVIDTPVETPVGPADEPVMVANADTPKGAFLAVAAQNGCALNVGAAEALLANAGLRMDQAFRIVDDLVINGEASLSSDGAIVTVAPALCGGAVPPVEQVQTTSPDLPATPPAATSTDPRAGLLAMLAANNCQVTQANVAGLVSAAGLDFNTSMQMLTQMMGSGEATSPDGGQTLQVGAPLCVAAGVEPMTPRETFINLIKQNNCSITAAEFSNLLPVNGLDATTAFGMISELEAEGVITLPATRDVVTLSAEMCR